MGRLSSPIVIGLTILLDKCALDQLVIGEPIGTAINGLGAIDCIARLLVKVVRILLKGLPTGLQLAVSNQPDAVVICQQTRVLTLTDAVFTKLVVISSRVLGIWHFLNACELLVIDVVELAAIFLSNPTLFVSVVKDERILEVGMLTRKLGTLIVVEICAVVIRLQTILLPKTTPCDAICLRAAKTRHIRDCSG